MHSKRNFSAKREAIYEVLASTSTHPTAEWVYEQLKPRIPDLSLGTVYRNLSVFKDMGIAKSVGVVNGQERFDAVTAAHPHFICTGCFTITDIPVAKKVINHNVYNYVEQECNVSVDTHSLTFFGLCSSCREKVSLPLQNPTQRSI